MEKSFSDRMSSVLSAVASQLSRIGLGILGRRRGELLTAAGWQSREADVVSDSSVDHAFGSSWVLRPALGIVATGLASTGKVAKVGVAYLLADYALVMIMSSWTLMRTTPARCPSSSSIRPQRLLVSSVLAISTKHQSPTPVKLVMSI